MYLGRLSSFITLIKSQSLRNASVMPPEVAVTSLKHSSSINLAFFAMYWLLRRSLSIKPSGSVSLVIKSFLYLPRLMALALSILSTRAL